MRHNAKDEKDLESTFPLISAEAEPPLRLRDDDNRQTFTRRWVFNRDDFNMWQSLFLGLLSLNILFGIIVYFYIDRLQQPLLLSQDLIPKSMYGSNE
jgi:hypothetical protein